jgi:hypothetical protein
LSIDYDVAEATKYAALLETLAGLDADYRTLEAQTHAAAIADLAAASPSPWAVLLADQLDAKAGLEADLADAEANLAIAKANAAKAFEIAQADAELLKSLDLFDAEAERATREIRDTRHPDIRGHEPKSAI